MGRMEEYYLWKRGELNKKMSKETIDLFKTEPTDYQLVALDAYDKRLLKIGILAILTYALIGFMYGYMTGVFYG